MIMCHGNKPGLCSEGHLIQGAPDSYMYYIHNPECKHSHISGPYGYFSVLLSCFIISVYNLCSTLCTQPHCFITPTPPPCLLFLLHFMHVLSALCIANVSCTLGPRETFSAHCISDCDDSKNLLDY